MNKATADEDSTDVNDVIEKLIEDLLDAAVCGDDTLAGGDESSLQEFE